MSKHILEHHKHLPYIMRIRKVAERKNQVVYNYTLIIFACIYLVLAVSFIAIANH